MPDMDARILAIANALIAEGISNPTNAQVRARLGGGSLSHISPVMRQWRADRQAEATTAPAMPEELKAALDSALGQLWSQANRVATQAVAHYRQEAEQALAETRAERDEALAEVARLEGVVAELTACLTEREGAWQQVNTELQQLNAVRAEQHSVQATLMARLEERDSTLTRLETELKEAKEDNRRLQGELVEIARKQVSRIAKKEETKPSTADCGSIKA